MCNMLQKGKLHFTILQHTAPKVLKDAANCLFAPYCIQVQGLNKITADVTSALDVSVRVLTKTAKDRCACCNSYFLQSRFCIINPQCLGIPQVLHKVSLKVAKPFLLWRSRRCQRDYAHPSYLDNQSDLEPLDLPRSELN